MYWFGHNNWSSPSSLDHPSSAYQLYNVTGNENTHHWLINFATSGWRTNQAGNNIERQLHQQDQCDLQASKVLSKKMVPACRCECSYPHQPLLVSRLPATSHWGAIHKELEVNPSAALARPSRSWFTRQQQHKILRMARNLSFQWCMAAVAHMSGFSRWKG